MRAGRSSSGPRSGGGRATVVIGLVIGLFAAGVAAWVIRPVHAGVVGSDAVASVLYFERLVSGERLELFLGTTPKPLLSAVYGTLHGLFDDWRPISWLAIVVYGMAVATTALLVRRVTGSLAGGLFTAVGLLASRGLLQDASLGYTVSWALLGWSSAGLALSADPPRPAVAGVLLMLAALARQETLFIVGAGLLALAAGSLVGGAMGAAAPRRATWLVGIGLLAIPIAATVDLLLTGDPLYSYSVPALGTEIRPPQPPDTASVLLDRHLDDTWRLLPLAAVGVTALIVDRAWPLLIGLAAIGPGVAAFVLLLGARGIYILDRYALPLDLAIIVAAGVGFGAAAQWVLLRLVRPATLVPARALLMGTAAAVAVALSPALAPVDDDVRAQIRTMRADLSDYAAARSTIAAAVDAIPGAREMPAEPQPSSLAPPDPPALLVPAAFLPLVAVELDLPLTQVQRIDVNTLSPDGSYPSAGQLVFHDASLDLPRDRVAFLEVDGPAVVGSIRVVPLLVAPGSRVWVVRIEAATTR